MRAPIPEQLRASLHRRFPKEPRWFPVDAEQPQTSADKGMVDAIAAVIRRHVRLEWHGHDHADINYRSTVAAAEEIVAQINLAIRAIAAGTPAASGTDA